jgi:hypothetical protein
MEELLDGMVEVDGDVTVGEEADLMESGAGSDNAPECAVKLIACDLGAGADAGVAALEAFHELGVDWLREFLGAQVGKLHDVDVAPDAAGAFEHGGQLLILVDPVAVHLAGDEDDDCSDVGLQAAVETEPERRAEAVGGIGVLSFVVMSEGLRRPGTRCVRRT